MKKVIMVLAITVSVMATHVFARGSSKDGGGAPVVPCWKSGDYMGTMAINICQSKYKGSPSQTRK